MVLVRKITLIETLLAIPKTVTNNLNKNTLMKKLLLIMFFISSFILSCEKEPCTKTIDTINGPQEIEVDCAFAD